MATLDHWHPVLPEGRLSPGPARVRVDGVDVVLFRDTLGRLGALEDRCPHRHMPLSAGEVVGDELRCAYHGWRFDRHGAGLSPGNPRLRPCARPFDAVARHGALWIRRSGSTAAFPALDAMGFRQAGVLFHQARAPLELVLDNFCEVEHTPVVHDLLGYEALDDVEVKTTATADEVRVYNVGPQKPIPAALGALFRIRPGDRFVDEWVTRFSPVHCIYDQYWLDGATGARRPSRLRNAVFFVPEGPRLTRLVTFVFADSPVWRIPILSGLTRLVALTTITREIALDARLLARMVGVDPALAGMKLGRFDKAIGLNRARLDALYRGGP